MVSIKDVAKEAGVAISTVSKVLNNYPNVSEATKKKVMDVVERLGFVPNSVAASLSSKKAGRVALLLKLKLHNQAGDEIHMQYIYGAIQKAKELQMDIVTIFSSMLENMSVDDVTRYLESQGIKGLIICGMTKDDKVLQQIIKHQNFKIVVIDAPFVNESTSSIGIDHAKAQYEIAMKTFQKNSCESILYIAGSDDGYVSDLRTEGIQKLSADQKIKKLMIRKGNFSELTARQITMKFAKNKSMVACASDLMAIGAMKALIDMDIFRPVCGFDGIKLMGYAGKQMSTVDQHFDRIAERAVVELDALMNGDPGQQIIMPYDIVRIKYEDVIA